MHKNSDDFQIFFPSEVMRKRFYDLLLEMTADQDGMITTEINTDYNTGVIKVFGFFIAFFPLIIYVKTNLR